MNASPPSTQAVPTRGKIHFLHVRKTGGTALRHALKIKGVPQVRIYGHGKTIDDVPRGEKFFFFLRNPITRFASGFLSRLRQGQPHHHNPWNEEEEIAFRRFPTPNKLARALSSGDEEERNAAIRAMNGIRNVKDPYWFWLRSPEQLLERSEDVLFIGRQEYLSDDVALLIQYLDCGPLELPNDEIAAHRTPSNFDTSLDELAAENLKQWYRGDFEAMRLCMQIARERGFGGSLADDALNGDVLAIE